jgi:hypothetical protein
LKKFSKYSEKYKDFQTKKNCIFENFDYLLGGYDEKCNYTSDCDEEFVCSGFLYDMTCQCKSEYEWIKELGKCVEKNSYGMTN